MMEKRIKINLLEASAYDGMFKLEEYIQNSKVSKTYALLIKLRASQINKCPFCIDMHTKEALKLGMENKKIFLLNAWQEVDIFSKEEKIILQMTEEISLIHQEGLKDTTYKKAIDTFGDILVVQLIMAIVTINSWNRIAISTKIPVE